MVVCGIKQAAVLVYDNLVDNPSSSVYSPIPITIGMCNHDTKKIIFPCVDDSGLNISVMKMHNIY